LSLNHSRIDPESRAPLKAFLATFPGGFNAIADIVERRAAIDSFYTAASNTESDEEGLSIQTSFVPSRDEGRSIEVRSYVPKSNTAKKTNPGLIFIHGGGMVMGNLDIGHENCKMFATRLGLSVFSINYRKAPESPYPAALEDCLDVTNWIKDNFQDLNTDLKNVGLYGGSAGGGLVLATALAARDAGTSYFKYMMPIYPMIDDSCSTQSAKEFTDIGIWDRRANIEAWDWYLGKQVPDSYAAPFRATDLRNLPSCYSDVGELDLFRDENIIFFQRLVQSGVATEFHMYPGAFHGSENIAPESSLSKKIWERRIEAISKLISM
jgi:hypothetical protein